MGVSELVPKCCHSDVVKSDTDRETNIIECMVLMRIIQLFTFSHLLENTTLENYFYAFVMKVYKNQRRLIFGEFCNLLKTEAWDNCPEYWVKLHVIKELKHTY